MKTVFPSIFRQDTLLWACVAGFVVWWVHAALNHLFPPNDTLLDEILLVLASVCKVLVFVCMPFLIRRLCRLLDHDKRVLKRCVISWSLSLVFLILLLAWLHDGLAAMLSNDAARFYYVSDSSPLSQYHYVGRDAWLSRWKSGAILRIEFALGFLVIAIISVVGYLYGRKKGIVSCPFSGPRRLADRLAPAARATGDGLRLFPRGHLLRFSRSGSDLAVYRDGPHDRGDIHGVASLRRVLFGCGKRLEGITHGSLHAVTGAFGYSGKYIAQRLLAEGKSVITLTNSLHRQNPFGDRVRAFPFHFDEPERLIESLRGVSVLYNTYWVRFNHGRFNHAAAVRNTLALFAAAKAAGVERVVHTSITHPSEDSPFEYFRGKARLERALIDSGMSYAVLRPTVLFGKEDILVNNIAWVLRRLPVFGVFGDGQYKLQPIHVDDFAEIAVTQGQKSGNGTIDTVGPETFTYRELVETVGKAIGKKRPVISVPPLLGYAVGWSIGKLMRDVFITWEEVGGLMANLLCVDSPPVGKTRLTDWAREQSSALGRRYASELARRK